MMEERDRESSVLVLGVDSGGTKSEAVLADASGNVIGHGFCDFRDPESGRGPGGSGRTRRTVLRAIQQALYPAGSFAPGVLHVAGRGQLPDGWAPEPWQAVSRFHPVREQDGALALAGTDAGIVVLAGTGAFVYARREDGVELHLDSLGPLLGDAGSAFEIGLRAVRAVARADWSPRHQTTLVGPILEACQSYSGRERGFSLVEYMLEHRDRSEIASLARIVDEHAEQGDGVAQAILRQAADSIAETLEDVIERLNLWTADLPLVAAGSVIRCSRTYWSRVCQRALEIAPGLRPLVPEHREVIGNIIAALPRLEGVAPNFAETLLAQALRLEGGIT